MSKIKDNLVEIEKKITSSCEKSNRKRQDIMLLAVTKTRSAKEINEVISLGYTNIGENRVQELLEKYDDVDKRAVWHLIGHLQTNKVKYIADKVSMIHSVDSVKLAKEIDTQCKKIGKIMDILIEVNVSGEESKFGASPNGLDILLAEIAKFSNIKVRGLMTMAPKNASENVIRDIFSNLFKISVDISQKKYNNINMDYLSMGMSNDFEIAVEQGSNIIRLGRIIFD
jgi:pyridoxal phosphate enzyme (YggS family)